MVTRALLCAAVLASTCAWSSGAVAQVAPAARDKDAERLFVEGRTAASAGDYATACARFTESLALVERPGTLLNLADCDERANKPLAASRRVERALALLDAADTRQTFARNRLVTLQARTPKLRFALSPALDPATRLELDEVAVDAASSSAVPVEPGRHRVTVREPGKAARTIEVDAAEGVETRVDVAPSSTAPAATPAPAPRAEPDYVPAFVAGGIGLAGFAVAGVTGVVLLTRDADIEAACPAKRCSAEGRDLIDGQGPLFVANAIGFGVGVVGVGLGTVLLLTADGGEAGEAALSIRPLPGGAGATIRGRL